MHECGNCQAAYADETDLLEVSNLWERIGGAGQVIAVLPSGECPDCGALCYAVPDGWEVEVARRKALTALTPFLHGIQANFLDELWTLGLARDVIDAVVGALDYEAFHALKEGLRGGSA